MHDFFVAAEGEKSVFSPCLTSAFACCASLKNGVSMNGAQIRGQVSN